MFNVNGIYKWRLIDTKGNLISSGRRKNIVTDVLINDYNTYNGFRLSVDHKLQIVLSNQSIPLPSLEYRELGIASANISQSVVSPDLDIDINDPIKEYTVNYIFPKPVSERTITVVGTNLRWHNGASWQTAEFFSFIEFSSPLIQKTFLNLYISYQFTLNFLTWRSLHSTNDYVKAWMNSELSTRLAFLAMRTTRNDRFLSYTPYTPAVNTGMIVRYLYSHGEFEEASATEEGASFAGSMLSSYSESEMNGVIGTVVWNQNAGAEASNQLLCLGQFVHAVDIVPSNSFPAFQTYANQDKVFYDPLDLPVSQGYLTLSGTLAVQFPVVVRLLITKTGDASDVFEENLTPSVINTSTDEISLSFDSGWAVDDIVYLEGTGTAPAPLSLDTNYYIAAITGTPPNTDIQLSLTEGGAVIDLTTTGTGVWKLRRFNTGYWRVTMEPWLQEYRNSQQTFQSQPFQDYVGNYFPATIDSTYSIPIRREDDYTYFIHPNVAGNRVNISSWPNNSVQSMAVLKRLVDSAQTLRGVVNGIGTYKNYAYIATDIGLWRYDLTNPIAVSPVQQIITGIIDTDIQDITFDETTEFLWTGHSTGLSKINLATNTATQYLTGGGNPLVGLTSEQVNISAGSMYAHNGSVLVAKIGASYIWTLLDGTGYTLLASGLTHVHCGCINKFDSSNVEVIIRYTQSEYWTVFRITGVTAPNTGTYNNNGNFAGGSSTTARCGPRMIQVSSTEFMGLIPYYSAPNYRTRYEMVVLGSSLRTADYTEGAFFEPIELTDPLNYLRNSTRCPIDIAGDDSAGIPYEVNVYMSGRYMIAPIFPTPLDFGVVGLNGSTWRRNTINDISIAQTTESLPFGLSVLFNNHPTADWDDQFVLNESATFIVAPIKIKEPSQTMTIRSRQYYSDVVRKVNTFLTVALTNYIPESPGGFGLDIDFREMDILDWVITVWDVTDSVWYTAVQTAPSDNQFRPYLNGRIDFNSADVGHSVWATYNYTRYIPEV